MSKPSSVKKNPLEETWKGIRFPFSRTRLACMQPGIFDTKQYDAWMGPNGGQARIDYPEWLIRQANPGLEIPGLTSGHWVGWTD